MIIHVLQLCELPIELGANFIKTPNFMDLIRAIQLTLSISSKLDVSDMLKARLCVFKIVIMLSAVIILTTDQFHSSAVVKIYCTSMRFHLLFFFSLRGHCTELSGGGLTVKRILKRLRSLIDLTIQQLRLKTFMLKETI